MKINKSVFTEIIAMAAPDSSNDDISVDEDPIYAAVEGEENDQSSLAMSVKLETVDEDMSLGPDPVGLIVNSILPESELEEDSEDSALSSRGNEQWTLTRDRNDITREHLPRYVPRKQQKHMKSTRTVSANRRLEFVLSHRERAFRPLSRRDSERTGLARAQRDLRRLKSKYSDRMRELLRLRALNLRLQEQLLLGHAPSLAPLTAPLAHLSTSPPVHARSTNVNAVSRVCPTSTVFTPNSPLISSTTSVATVPTPPPDTLRSVVSPEEKTGTEDMNDAYLTDASARPTDEPPKIYLETISKVKRGVFGDSMFTKHLAMSMWGAEKLRNRSVKGRRCNSKKGSVARCPLSPDKLKIVREHFVTRMMSEQPPPSAEEQKKRIASINGFISDKIITLNRVSI